MVDTAADPTIYQRPAELLQRLIRFDTTNPPGNEAACIAYLDGLLKAAGFETTILARDPARPNLVTRLAGQGGAPPLLLCGHVDVVTTRRQVWQHPPFAAEVADGYIWGRGALDMKGGIAMMVAALLRARLEGLAPAGDIILAVVADEEAQGGFGARFLVEEHAGLFEGVRYAIGEFGGFSLYVGSRCFYPIMVAEKRACWMKATLRGPGGHGSLPVRDGAMARLGQVLDRLARRRLPVHVTPVVRRMLETMAKALPFPQSLIMRQLTNPAITDRVLNLLGPAAVAFDPLLHNTVSPTIVQGGEKVNVIPSEVTLELDGRLLPGYAPDDLLAELRHVAGVEMEIEVTDHEAGPAEPDMGLFDMLGGILREADSAGVPVPLLLGATTDGRLFQRLGIQTYGFLPMNLPAGFNFVQTIHAADERIPEPAVAFGAAAIFRLLERYGR